MSENRGLTTVFPWKRITWKIYLTWVSVWIMIVIRIHMMEGYYDNCTDDY